jgi:hypothetical protein
MKRHGRHSSDGLNRLLIIPALAVIASTAFLPTRVTCQSNPRFDITLQIDYSSAEQMLGFFERQTYNVDRVASARGNKIAAATSLLLGRTNRSPQDFAQQLELVRDDYNTSDDLYGLKAARSHVPQLKKLLTETQKRQLDRRVVATVQAYFPSNADIEGTIPVYVVVMGNERAAAFVRRVVWKDDWPVFVGDNEGEQVIVLNLTRMLEFSSDVNAQFIQTLGTLAHESFHAIFGLYQQSSQTWREYHQRIGPFWPLAEVVQNEGIAYLLSLQLQIGGQVPPNTWFDATGRAIKAFNRASKELISPSISSQRARELILNANMSGSFEANYGATAGQRMAYEIDTKFGRQALANTIIGGVQQFFGTYDSLCAQNSNLPRVDAEVMKVLEQ